MSDRFTVRAVVIFLGTAVLMGLGLIGLLAFYEKVIPDALIATTSAAAGALGAVLAQPRLTTSDTEP